MAADPRPSTPPGTSRVGFLNQRPKNEKVLSLQQLKGMEQHKYASEGNTLLDPLMQKFWNFVVTLVPLWVAPNLITIFGLVLNVIGGALVFIYLPSASTVDYDDDTPQFVKSLFLLNAITLFLYQTLDAIDGKQARRTNTSSPLGELFDHGMDSISTSMVGVSMLIAVYGGKEPDLLLLFTILVSSAFYLAHWSTYITGKLQFSFIDVTEAQWVSIGLLLVSYFFGPTIWDSKVFGPFPLRYAIYLSLTFNFCTRLKEHLDRIIAGGVGPNGSTVAGTSVIGPAQPLLYLTLLVALIHFGDTQLVRLHPVLFCLASSLCYSKIANKIIVAHMSKTDLEKSDSCYAGLGLLLLNVYFGNLLGRKFALRVGSLNFQSQGIPASHKTQTKLYILFLCLHWKRI